MAGDRTHEQQLRIIEGKENTRNADKDFDADKYLHRSEEEREMRRESGSLRDDVRDLVDKDDHEILRGENQESRHHKNRPDD